MFDKQGADRLFDALLGDITFHIDPILPSKFNEEHRYLPKSVTARPGPMSFKNNPFMREIVDCAAVESPVREVNVLKGVQITWSTLLESVALYYMCHVKTLPMMYMTADNELASARLEGNFLVMLNQSNLSGIIQSADTANRRKSGSTKNKLEWEGGGYMLPFGAKNADKMRQFSIAIMLKDELDGWADTVGKDGDPDKLSDARCDGYWERRKIYRGSTPLIKSNSKIYKQFLRGDERVYNFHCLKCGFPQTLVEFSHDTGVDWHGKNKETGKPYGFTWEMKDGVLVRESVRYCCRNCGADHFDHDKDKMFSIEDNGALWVPTSAPVSDEIRSYFLPAFYSPFKPWSARIEDFLEAFDIETRKPKDFGKFQVFYNNITAWPFEIRGDKIQFQAVSGHRRTIYKKGQIPNPFAEKFAGGKILFLTCQVDVQKRDLAVTVMGWTVGARCFVIDYRRIVAKEDEPPCVELHSPVWAELREIIEETVYESTDGYKYRILLTLIDAGWGDSHDAVLNFCADYESGVIPIIGRDRPEKGSRIKEFETFETQLGTIGYKITVDHYKDRLAPVLRREWYEANGEQNQYHFNAPVDMTDKELKELTAETRKKKVDAKGIETWFWHRPSGRDNELWDLLVYGHGAVEIIAWDVCVRQHRFDGVVWAEFWKHMAEQLEENQKLF